MGPVSADPTAMLGGAFRVQITTLAWGAFAYKGVSRAFVAILSSALQGSAQTGDQIWNTVWGVLYDLEAAFQADITQRTLTGCAGIQLLLGETNPWAELAYGSCAMGAEYYASIFRITLDLFVDVPMIKCVCKDAAGQNPRLYVQSQCAPSLPVSVRPTLYMIVNGLQV